MDGILNIALIMLIVVGSLSLTRYWKHKLRLAEMKFQAEKTYDSEFKQEIADLRSRVIALEKIITGKGYRLQDEIEQL